MQTLPSHIHPKRVSVVTLGCKLNQYDSEVILTQFRSAGFDITDEPETADICIINSCAVTNNAERKTKSLLRSLHRKNPNAKILAVGCVSEHSPSTISEIPGVNVVLGNSEKLHILDYINDLYSEDLPQVFVGETANTQVWNDGLSVDGLLGRTRGFLKVQDGCSQKCTYCVIPSLRGSGRSLNIASVVDKALRLVAAGFAEIVITGVALGTYGFDLGQQDGLIPLLTELEKINGLNRIRLGSVEPWAVTDAFLQIVAESKKICPHLHIPLQSAEDSVLHRMNRRYTVSEIAHIFEYAYSLRSDWGFGTDIIVGFPGEGRTEFERTRDFLSSSPLSYLHVFPFSLRSGTSATKLKDAVGDTEKKERVRELKELDHSLRLNFRKKNLQTVQSVLFEQRSAGSLLAGHSTNYLDVFADLPASFAGTIQQVKIIDLHSEGVVGRIISEDFAS